MPRVTERKACKDYPNAGAWPAELRGRDLVRALVLIDKGVEHAAHFPILYHEAMRDGEVAAMRKAVFGKVARLQVVGIGSLRMPDEGVADPEIVEGYAAMSTEAPPVIVFDRELRDGNHRVAAARAKGRHMLLAYVIESEAKLHARNEQATK